MANLTQRHNGHANTASDFYKRNDDIVKYGFWVIIAILAISITLFRIISLCTRAVRQSRSSLARRFAIDGAYAEQFRKSMNMGVRSCTASFRRMTYPRLTFGQGWLRYLDPPSQGEAIFLLTYWTLLSAGLWINVIFKSPIEAYGIQWEVVGFRAAWVGTTQFPLLYATGCKYNVLSLLTGVSVQRLNWFHRWIARTLFGILGIHWTFFFQEWVLAGFVRQEIEMMPMVIWGFAAWTAIGVMVISGFRWFRDKAFELWLVSHIVLAWSVLAMSYTHTHCTTHFVVASLACLVYDLAIRLGLAMFHNLALIKAQKRAVQFGHQLRAEVLDKDYVRLTIDCSNFSWKAGQYVYLTIPVMQPFQSHPFTIVNAKPEADEKQEMVIIVKKHSGFTKRLYRWASDTTNKTLRCFLQGPHGTSSIHQYYDTAVLISMGNRASYCVSILQDLVCRQKIPAKIYVYVIVANHNLFVSYEPFLRLCSDVCLAAGSSIDIHVYVSRGAARTEGIFQEDTGLLTSGPFVIGRSSVDSDRSVEGSEMTLKDDSANDIILHDGKEAETGVASGWREKRTSAEAQQARPEDEIRLLAEDKSLACLDQNSLYCCKPRILYGRPEAEVLLHEPIERSTRTEQILIVAAVSSPLAANLSRQVCKYIANSKAAQHSGSIRLWIEQNG